MLHNTAGIYVILKYITLCVTKLAPPNNAVFSGSLAEDSHFVIHLCDVPDFVHEVWMKNISTVREADDSLQTFIKLHRTTTHID